MASLAFYMKREVFADYIPTPAFWIACVLLGASSLLPALFPQVPRQLTLSLRTLGSAIDFSHLACLANRQHPRQHKMCYPLIAVILISVPNISIKVPNHLVHSQSLLDFWVFI